MVINCKLGDIAFIKNGKTNAQDAIPNGSYPLFDRSTSIKRSNNYLFDCSATIVPGEGKSFIPRYYSGKFDLHQRCYCLQSKDENKINSRYLYYNVYANHDYFSRVAVGSTVPSLRLDSFLDMDIKLHSIEEQQHIVDTIGSVDDLIEKNEEILKKLEQFSYTFFHYEFVNKGERSYRLSDICNFESGYSYTGEELKESKIGMISIKCIGPNGAFKQNGIKSLFPKKSISKKKECSVGDVLVAHTDLTKNQEIIGAPCIVTSSANFDSLTYSMDMVKVTPFDGQFSKATIYQILKSPVFHNYALGFCSGTTVVHLSKRALETYEFLGPNVIKPEMASCLEDLQNLVIQIENKNSKLKTMKNVLLQKYFGSC